MNLKPRGIREHLDLNKPIFARTSAYGHFGRERCGRRPSLGIEPTGRPDQSSAWLSHHPDAIAGTLRTPEGPKLSGTVEPCAGHC
jgi:hypothetical protein